MQKSLKHFGCLSLTHVFGVSQLTQLSNPDLVIPRDAQRSGLAWIRRFTVSLALKEEYKAESSLFGIPGSKSTSSSSSDDWEDTFREDAIGSKAPNSMFGLFGSKWVSLDSWQTRRDNAAVQTAPPKTDTPSAPPEEATMKNSSQLWEPLEFEASVKVDAAFLRFVIGTRGEMKEKIGKETKTELFIPRWNEVKKGSCLVVKGRSQAAVDGAVAEIQRIVKEAEAGPKMQYSHFVSLPLALSPVLLERVKAFQESVLASHFAVNEPETAQSGDVYTEAVEKPSDNGEKTIRADEVKESESVSSYEDIIRENIAFLGEVDFGETKLKGCSNDENQADVARERDNGKISIDEVQGDDGDAVAECVMEDTEEHKESAAGHDRSDTQKHYNAESEKDKAEAPEEENGDFVAECDREGTEEDNEESDAEYDGPDTDKNNDSEPAQDQPGTTIESGYGIDKSLFIRPATFHLTVLMLKLWNEERVAAASKILQGLKPKLLEVLENRPVSVTLRGMESLGGSPEKTNVLYLRAEEANQEDRLVQACMLIIDAFSEAGLVLEKDKSHDLQMHATLMNTAHRRRRRGKHFLKRRPFNATKILNKHGSDDWGKHRLVEIHLSQRFIYGEDGYYRCCSSIQLPPVA